MPARSPFQYAALRIVPRVERGEAVNAGVVLFCRPLRFLGARTQLDEALLEALSPNCDPAAVREQLRVMELIAAGDPEPAGRSRHSPPPSASTGWSRPRARSSSPARSTRGSRAIRPRSSTTCSRSSWNADAVWVVYVPYGALDSVAPDALPDVLELRTADLLRERGDVPGMRDAAAPLRATGRAAPEPRPRGPDEARHGAP